MSLLVLSQSHSKAEDQIVALLGVAEVVVDVLGSEPQSWIIQTKEPIVPPVVLFAREKLVEIEPPQLGASVIGLQMVHD